MDDEFKTVGNELNKPIAEFQQLEAMEYYPINEAVAAPLENLGVNEDLTDDSGTKANEAAGKSRIETAQERLDNVNRITNTADGVRSPSLDMNAAAEADAEAAVAEASASAGVTVTSTVASLAGTVSVVAVAAAAVVSVAGGLIEKEPSLVSENYEVGTNYIKYEIDIEELSENMDYKIKVSNPNFEIEYPILEAGLQRQIVPDLLPYRRYDLEIIGTDPNVGDIVYYKRECYTDILTKPKAVFKFTPHFDYILGRLDLEYETYISNFYNNADNTYLQIYSGDRLVLEDKELPEDNFFRGTIYNLGSADAIRAVAYTDWFNGAFTVPNTEIGTFGYEIDVPDDFEFKNVFTGTYTFGTECFSKSFDLESGTNLAIDTNFKTTDSNEAYRIDVYNKDEIIKSVTSSDEIVNINLDSYLRNIDLKFTPIKYDGDEITEYEPTIVKKYDIDPKIFSEIAFYQYEGGIYFDSRVSDEFKEKMEQKPITLKIVKNFIDGTSLEVSNIVELIDGEYISYEGGITDEQDKTLADVLSFDISLTYGDTLIEKFNSPTISNATLGTADVDDDGNIIIPFELDLSSMEDVKVEPYIDERDLEIEYDGKNGTIIVSELESNIVNVELRISYVVDGVTTYATQMIEEYNLGADYEVSYFVSHVGSFYTQLDIKYDATINGKNANINLYPVVTKDELELESTGSYLDYYVFEYGEGEYNITYKLGNYGFDAEEVTIPVNSSMPFYDSNMESLNIGYYDTFTNEVFVYYTKTYNEDGTVNYIFDVPFEDNGGNHYARIEGAYEEDGVTKYICTDLVTSDWKLLNVPDYDYSLGIRPYYRTSDGILYDLSINNNSILKTKELSDLYVESETYLGALVNEDDEDNPTLDAVLDFNFRTKSLDLSKNLTLIYYGKEYQIDIIEPTEELVSGNDAYFESFDYRYYSAIKYTITKDGYGYTVVYYKESGDYKYDRLMVEFFIIDGGKELDKDAFSSIICIINN